ncbi:hypothetical protein LY10_00135 [Planktotalea frisia]|jgi:hypothetical protein|uniref:Uncharacterized protein n=1 Tax=Planktotalea frisia TaxID=696762 RepID=A0A1L9NZ65_9RHOB|nr:hypothetical protein PFRI_11190 [Planktotalea frisia]PZX35751.1 hypothetical protein LY10_00135 [Planktotalea frisia]
MTHYIAELDESQEIAAVWVKEKAARGPTVFDPQKHIFDANTASRYFGAPKEKITHWIAGAQQQSRNPR